MRWRTPPGMARVLPRPSSIGRAIDRVEPSVRARRQSALCNDDRASAGDVEYRVRGGTDADREDACNDFRTTSGGVRASSDPDRGRGLRRCLSSSRWERSCSLRRAVRNRVAPASMTTPTPRWTQVCAPAARTQTSALIGNSVRPLTVDAQTRPLRIGSLSHRFQLETTPEPRSASSTRGWW